jgi:hypothetical protein
MGRFWPESFLSEPEPTFCQNRAILTESFLASVIIRSGQNLWLPFDFLHADFYLLFRY